MAIQRSEAILLRRQDLRETSLILTFYTKGFGKVRGVIRGARGGHVRQGGAAFELLAHDDIVFYERKRSDIFTVSHCDLIDYFAPLRADLAKLGHALYLGELLDALTELGEPHQAVFELLRNALALMAGETSPRRVARIFEIRLLDLLGMMPQLGVCVQCGAAAAEGSRFSFRSGGLICPSCTAHDGETAPILAGTINFIEHIRQAPFDRVGQVKVAEQVGRDLEGILRTYLDYHLGRRLNTLSFLRAIES